jgi:hypothetical protein
MPSRAEIVTFDDSPAPPGAKAGVAEARKQQVIREICHRAFVAAGLLEN